MKKIFLMLLFALPLVLCACSGSGKPPKTDPNGTKAPGGTTNAATTTAAKTEAPDEPEKPDVSTLKGAYADDFRIGIALPNNIFNEWSKYGTVITDNFNSFTCENEMKPDALLDREATVANVEANYTEAKVKFTAPKRLIEHAVACGAKVRLHTLVWHSQTPNWFFTEDYTDNGKLVSREVMLQRMENYIKDVLTYFKENYPGLVYAVDVVNEAVDPGTGDANGIRVENSKWYATIGPDFIYYAFLYARKYAAPDMKLFYNDYACMWKPDQILNALSKAKEEGLIDGIGMQSHLDINTSIDMFVNTAKRFCDEGYEVQLTELDVGVPAPTEDNFEKQGRYFENLMKGIVKLRRSGANITAVTVWGLSDGFTWRPNDYPLLFDKALAPKPAFDGFLAASGV